MSRHLVFCNLDGRPILGIGTSRVLNSVLFHFCKNCWENRYPECEKLMLNSAAIPAKKVEKASA